MLSALVVAVVAEHEEVVAGAAGAREIGDDRVHVLERRGVLGRVHAELMRAPVRGLVVAHDEVILAAAIRLECDARAQRVARVQALSFVRRQPLLEERPELRERLVTDDKRALADAGRVEE